MTVKAWRELVQNYSSGGMMPSDLRGRYSSGVIKGIFDLVYEEIVYEIFKHSDFVSDYGELDSYVMTYEGEEDGIFVKKSSTRGAYYFDLPHPIIQLPQGQGIRSISSLKDPSYKFNYLEQLLAPYRSKLEISKISLDPVYYIEKNKVWLLNYNPIVKDLLVKLLAPISAFDEDDELGIPANHAKDIFTMITDLLRKQLPEKKSPTAETSKQI
jgi:hypothetical protein